MLKRVLLAPAMLAAVVVVASVAVVVQATEPVRERNRSSKPPRAMNISQSKTPTVSWSYMAIR
jgi:hypothetical protein